MPDPFLPTLTAADVLEPLDDVVGPEQLGRLRDLNRDCAVDGRQLAVVWETSNYALFWNQTILDEAGVAPPTDMEELLAAARQITERTGKVGLTRCSRLPLPTTCHPIPRSR